MGEFTADQVRWLGRHIGGHYRGGDGWLRCPDEYAEPGYLGLSAEVATVVAVRFIRCPHLLYPLRVEQVT